MPYIISFDIGSNKIYVRHEIYAGCNETEEFNCDIPTEFLFMDKNSRQQYLHNYLSEKEKQEQNTLKKEKQLKLRQLQEEIKKLEK